MGPLLWNIMYEGVLDIRTNCDTSLVAYADELMENVNQMLNEIVDLMKTKYSRMAAQKSEAIMLHCRKRYEIIFTLEDTDIRPYLGVMLEHLDGHNSKH